MAEKLKTETEAFSNQRKALRDLFLSEFATFVNSLYVLRKDTVMKKITNHAELCTTYNNIIFIEVEEISFHIRTTGSSIRCYAIMKFMNKDGTCNNSFNFWFGSFDNEKFKMLDSESDSILDGSIWLTGDLAETAKTLSGAQHILFEDRDEIIKVTVYPELKGEIYYG